MGIGAAFIFGLLGSLHCIGMCGPLALAIPGNNGWPGRLLYNLGRVTSYTLLGLIFGLAGGAARLAGMQQGLSIAAGTSILFWLLLPKNLKARLREQQNFALIHLKLRRGLSHLLKSNQPATQWGIGILNGLLPCGFVYLALAGALAQPSIAQSAFFMTLFGLGTFPAMLVISYAPYLLAPKTRISIRRALPIGTAIIAVLLILRGLSLGIPYVSPKLALTPAAQESMPACHQH